MSWWCSVAVSPHYRMSPGAGPVRCAASCLSVVRCEAGPHTSLGPHSISRRGADTRHRDRNESRDQAEPSGRPGQWERADTRLAGDSGIADTGARRGRVSPV